MHIDIEMEEVEEHPMETHDDESIKDETYKMFQMPPSENNIDDDDESNDSGVRQEVENDGEGMVKGTPNPRSRRRAPFHPSPTIHILHKSLWYIVTSYKGKGATKKVKKL
jgi:hypothetical protein